METRIINGTTVYCLTRDDVDYNPTPFQRAAETWLQGKNKDKLSAQEIKDLKERYSRVESMPTMEAIDVFGEMVEAGLMTTSEARNTWYGFIPMTPEEMANTTGILRKCTAKDDIEQIGWGTLLARKEKALIDAENTRKQTAVENVSRQNATYLSENETIIQKLKNHENSLGILMGGGITEEKQINWDADGSAKLTPEQIEDLKSRYGMVNMSKQDYYDLMADLTNMNVISANDVVSQFVKPIVSGVVSNIGQSVSAVHNVFRSIEPYKDLLEYTKKYLEEFNNMLTWLWYNSSNMDSKQFFSLKESFESDEKTYQKLNDIFEILA